MEVIDQIRPIQGHECLSACIGNVLHVVYPKIAANEVVIGGDGFFITYERDRKVIGSPMYEANYRFMDKTGMKYVHEKCRDLQEAKCFLDDAIINNHIVIIKVNAKKLSYSRVFGQATDSSHFINVLGKESGQYVICDGYVPTRDATVFYGNMEEQDLYSAWADKEYEYVLIEKLPDKTETELLKEIESSLVKSIRTYCSGGCEDNVIWGKDAIYEMFKEIQAHIDKEGAYEVNYQLRIYGFLATKKMLLSMLQKEVRWQTVALQYEEIVQEWDCICMFFFKAVLSRKDELYERLLVRVQKCIESEVLILEQVIEVGGVSCRNLRFVMG